MTNFTKQKLFRLFLVKGLVIFGDDTQKAVQYGLMLMNQFCVLASVYEDLHNGWISYTKAQIEQEGAWKDCSIYTTASMRLSPYFEESQVVNFWVYYSLEQNWAEKLKIQPRATKAGRGLANETHWLSDVHPILVREWEALFYNHNYISIELFEKLYPQRVIESFSKVKR